jgi:ribonuclease III
MVVNQALLDKVNLPLDEVPHRNPANRWLTTEAVTAILRQFKVYAPIHNIQLYQRAFIHESFIKRNAHKSKKPDPAQEPDPDEPESEQIATSDNLEDYSQEQIELFAQSIPMQLDCNERLEFLGDTILCLSTVDYLYHRYPTQDEGFLTQTRIEVIRGENLARLAKRFKWGDYLLLSRQYESHRYTDPSYLENAFEALIGALYLDFGGRNGSGLFQAYTFITNIIEQCIDLSQIIYRDNNYKDLLLQYYHRHFDGQFPRYKTLSVNDQYHKRLYTVGVLGVDGQILVKASHQRKVRAEQLASRAALKYFKQEVCSSSDEE